MIDDDDDPTTPLDTALRLHLHDAAEPDDDGFSLRVMAALPVRRPARQRRQARWVRRAHWVAMFLAACVLVALLHGAGAPPGLPRALAATAVLGLLIFWSIPSRWSRA